MLVIGRLRPLPVAWEQQYTREVDLTPWPRAKAVSAVLLSAVVLIYARFARF